MQNPVLMERLYIWSLTLLKILLPRMLEQPGQLHFVTRLKFYFFCVSDSNRGTNFIFGLPEGHWTRNKTANVVISMIAHILQMQIIDNNTGCNLVLHADNCSRQNKNRFVLWYLTWRIIMKMDNSIKLCFLIAGHTKNVCDGSLGHVKRHLKSKNVYNPFEMMDVINNSSKTTACIPGLNVRCIIWKEFLELFFFIPSNFQITKCHSFEFDNSNIGTVKCRYDSASIEF